MSRSLRRGALAATALAFSLASLSACGAGNDAQTLGVRPDNAAATLGDIKIQNAIVVTQPDQDQEGSAVVAATLFNEGSEDETLESITLPGRDVTVELSAAKGRGDLVVPAGGSLILGGEGNASAVIADGREASDGSVQEVTFDLSTTGDVTLKAFVVPAEGYYTGVGPSDLPEAPSPSATPSPSSSPDGLTDPSGEDTGGHEGAEGTEGGTDEHAADTGATTSH